MVVALAGRRIDAPGAKALRFPFSLTGSVKRRLIACLRSVNAKHLVCSGACGADLLALEAAKELGIRKTMVLPFDAATFRSTSVTDRPGNWGSIYDEMVTALKRSNQLIELQYDKEDPDVYVNTNFSILDEAQKIAEQTGPHNNDGPGSAGKMMALVVWEGRSKNGDDTTYHFMQEAKKRNFIIKEILSDQ